MQGFRDDTDPVYDCLQLLMVHPLATRTLQQPPAVFQHLPYGGGCSLSDSNMYPYATILTHIRLL